MAPEAQATPSSRRPRTSLLVLLGLVIVVFLVTRIWSGNPAGVPAPPSNPRTQAQAGAEGQIDPGELDVRLEDLTRNGTEAAESSRNPFRFRPPPPPPPPPVQTKPVRPPEPEIPVGPPQPPPPPPIPLKFIGIVEQKPGDRIAAFSDCRMTFYGRPGDVVAGQYKLVQIGVESVTMEYVDGRGRTTIRMTGQECVTK